MRSPAFLARFFVILRFRFRRLCVSFVVRWLSLISSLRVDFSPLFFDLRLLLRLRAASNRAFGQTFFIPSVSKASFDTNRTNSMSSTEQYPTSRRERRKLTSAARLGVACYLLREILATVLRSYCATPLSSEFAVCEARFCAYSAFSAQVRDGGHHSRSQMNTLKEFGKISHANRTLLSRTLLRSRIPQTNRIPIASDTI